MPTGSNPTRTTPHPRRKGNKRQRVSSACTDYAVDRMFLSSEELIELTGKQQRSAQMRALRYMGIEHKTRADGTLVVLKSHIEKLLDGVSPDVRVKRVEPNWEALNA
ncbi:MAG: DUF4224 domain-containing protein [Alphaproteobacteria bacterium]|nr:DUF4224 domain-containing protein [Alphaproteobacteria bacterium]